MTTSEEKNNHKTIVVDGIEWECSGPLEGHRRVKLSLLRDGVPYAWIVLEAAVAEQVAVELRSVALWARIGTMNPPELPDGNVKNMPRLT